MKIEKGLIEFKNGLIISYWQQWYELFHWKKFNWNNFDILHIQFENDTWTGAYEFTLVLFLLGLTIRIPHETEKSKKLWKKISNATKKLNESCCGWVNAEEYRIFRKNKKSDEIEILEISNKKAYQFKKKIFIQ
jgi:hypothetical protein